MLRNLPAVLAKSSFIAAMARTTTGLSLSVRLFAPCRWPTLCNLRSDELSAPVRNGLAVVSSKLRNTLRAGQVRRNPRQCRGKGVFRYHPKERSVCSGRAGKALQHSTSQRSAPSRDSSILQIKENRALFGHEAHYVQVQGKYRRVTKHQARKKGWTSPEAMQVASSLNTASLSLAPVLSIEPTPGPPSSTGVPAQKREAQSLGSCRSAGPIPVVTDCPACGLVEEGFCVGENEQPVPFKAVRSHGVIVIPQFYPGRQSSLAIGGYQPRITVKKFRTVTCDCCSGSYTYGAYGFYPECGSEDRPNLEVTCEPEGCMPGCNSSPERSNSPIVSIAGAVA